MAISKDNCEKIMEGFSRIFPEEKIFTKDPKADGGFENIYVRVTRVSPLQYKQLVELTSQVKTSFSINSHSTRVQLLFY